MLWWTLELTLDLGVAAVAVAHVAEVVGAAPGEEDGVVREFAGHVAVLGAGAEDVAGDHAAGDEEVVLDGDFALVEVDVDAVVAAVGEHAVPDDDVAFETALRLAVDGVGLRGGEFVLGALGRGFEPHAGLDAFGFALGVVIAVHEGLVDHDAVEDHVGARAVRELQRDDADALGVVLVVRGLDLGGELGEVAGGEVVGVAALDGDGLVDDDLARAEEAGVVAGGHVDGVAGLGGLHRVEQGLEGFFLRAGAFFLAVGLGDVEVGAEDGRADREAHQGHQEFFHVV